MNFEHTPVLLKQTIEGLKIKPDGIYLDGTVGGAGHSREIAKKLNKNGKLICLDQDEDALKEAKKNLSQFENATVIKSNFVDFDKVLDELKIEKIDGILLDLGVSSYQLDNKERGFSYHQDYKLDMRMDKSNKKSAHTVVNEYSEKELSEIIYTYGEEKWAKRIAKFIVEERKIKPIETTFELVEIIKKAIPKKAREDKHPARKTFQALRIEVNDELEVLKNAIYKMPERINAGGRIAIITFHSLEDRIVKDAFKYMQLDCICDPNSPICTCDKKQEIKIITRKPLTANEEELEKNQRSRSAKLRIAEVI